MRRFIYFTATAIVLGGFANGIAQWQLQVHLSSDVPLASVKAVNGDVAWVCDASQLTEVYRTTNGGKKWLRRKSRLSSVELLTAIEALDSTTVFVGVGILYPGGHGGIYRSTDGGRSWQRVYLTSHDEGIAGIHFFDSQNGIAFPDGGVTHATFPIVKTTDGGATWAPITNPPAANRNEFMTVNNFYFFDNQNGWFATGDIAGTNGGRIFRSTDGGETWAAFNAGTASFLNGVYFISPQTGIRTAFDSPNLMRTTDGGQTWTAVANLPVSSVQSMSRASGISTQGVHRLWVAGDNGTQGSPAPFMLMSKDGGMSWEQQSLPDLNGDLISHHSAVVFGAAADSVQVFAVTASADFESGGRILSYRTKLDEVTAVQDQPAVPAAFALSQNYPNPFNPSTVISFQLPVSSHVKLAIYNTMGQLVRTLVDGQKPGGTHSIVWDATDDAGLRVASGVYVYVIRAGEFVSQRKLVLMK